jgi:hypothetical protein
MLENGGFAITIFSFPTSLEVGRVICNQGVCLFVCFVFGYYQPLEDRYSLFCSDK